jgi:hypothetical protein
VDCTADPASTVIGRLISNDVDLDGILVLLFGREVGRHGVELGQQHHGQLGNGTTTTAATPMQVPGLTATVISAGIPLSGSPGQFKGIG